MRKVPPGSSVPGRLPAEPFPRLGEYQLIRKLGPSGMAEVYLARRLGPSGVTEHVILRRLREDLSNDRRAVELFTAEARAAQILLHPAIARALQAKVIEGRYCICLEHLDGESLEVILGRCQERGTPISVTTALLMALTVLDALEYAHGLTDPGHPRGIVHGGICPGNIVIGSGGVLKLYFGELAGKMSYAAPEQLRSQRVDGRADLWALGVILFEALTNRRLFARASEQESMAAVLSDPIPSPRSSCPDLPDQVTTVVSRALVRDAGRRYPHAAAMRMDVERALAAITPNPASPDSEPLLSEFFEHQSSDRLPGAGEKTQRHRTKPTGHQPAAGPARPPRKRLTVALLVAAAAAAGSLAVATRTGREPAPGPLPLPPAMAVNLAGATAAARPPSPPLSAPAQPPLVAAAERLGSEASFDPAPPIPSPSSGPPGAKDRSDKRAPLSSRPLTTREAAVAFERARSQLLGCFEQFSESVTAGDGEITLSVVVVQSGAVREATVTSPPVGSADLDACIVARARKLKFRSHPDREVRINVPFVYRVRN